MYSTANNFLLILGCREALIWNAYGYM